LPTIPLAHWQTAAVPPPLDDHGIHVWRLPTQVPADAADWLDADEQRRLRAMIDPAARRQRLATRAGLRRVLAGYLGCAPAAVRLRVADGGKPHLAAGPCFNLSHCRDLALLAVARRPVGIDVELLRPVPRALAIARRVLDDATVQQLDALPAVDRDAAFIAAWTAMEARQKCLGQGVFGRRVARGEVAEQAFRPDARHHAQLAWMADLAEPRLQWLALSGHDLS